MQQQLFITPAQIPDDIARLAHEQKLGTPQGDYPIVKLVRAWRWHFFIFITLLCLALVSLIAAFIILLQPLSEEALNITSTFVTWLQLSYSLFSGYLATLTFILKNYHLYPCSEGLILKESKKKFRTIRWTEIDHIWQTVAHTPKSAFKVHRVYKIQCYDGYTLTFSGHLPTLAGLDKSMNQHFNQFHLPAYLADYKSGRTLNFGPLTISLNGMSVRDNMLPWEQIADISLLKDRRLVIQSVGDQQKPWLTIPTFKVPNLMILLALVEKIRTGQFIQEQSKQPLEPTSMQPAMPLELTTPPVTSMSWLAHIMYRMNQLPEDIAALAAEHNLGERRRNGKLGTNRVVTWLMIVFQFIGMSISGGIMYGMVNLIGLTRPQPYDVMSTYFSLFFAVGFPLLFAIVWLIFFIIEFPHIYRYTYTFEQGLILKYGSKAPAICRWDNIEAIWHVYHPLTSQPEQVQAHIIQLRDGSKYKLSRLDIDQQALGQLLREQVTPLQLPAFISAYHASQTLPFGPLRVSQEGIATGERLLPWTQVKSVTLEANTLVIYDIAQRKPWGKLAAARVPNLFVLFALADYVREQAVSHEN